MPCARVVFSYRRELAAQERSAWWADSGGGEARLRRYTETLREELRDVHFLVHEIALEEFSARRMTQLATCLGARCRFRELAVQNADGSYDALPNGKCERY